MDPLVVFKMLTLKQLFNLGDLDLLLQLDPMGFFEELGGLGVMNSIPVKTSIAVLRERLRKGEYIEELSGCLRPRSVPRALKLAPARSSMQRLSAFRG
jgi:hypothetical protein